MKSFIVSMLLIAATTASAASLVEGLKNESEAGVVITSGNTKTQSYLLRQLDQYEWKANVFKLTGRFLRTVAKGQQTAKNWSLGLRYERELADRFSIFLAQTLDSDIFAGYRQKYSTDVGGKYHIFKTEEQKWFVEAGYRYTIENRVSGEHRYNHYARVYTEAERQWNKSFSTKLWLEYLPNFTTTEDWQFNGEASLTAMLTEIFSIKSAYMLRFDNLPAPGATHKTDSTFTTSLVAKF